MCSFTGGALLVAEEVRRSKQIFAYEEFSKVFFKKLSNEDRQKSGLLSFQDQNQSFRWKGRLSFLVINLAVASSSLLSSNDCKRFPLSFVFDRILNPHTNTRDKIVLGTFESKVLIATEWFPASSAFSIGSNVRSSSRCYPSDCHTNERYIWSQVAWLTEPTCSMRTIREAYSKVCVLLK